MSLSGSKARRVLAKLQPSCRLGPDTFPHLAMRAATMLGVSARIYRVSFSGELTHEINVPASAALKIWEALLAEGQGDGLDVYGVEALLRLRLEKASSKPRDYIGKRSLALPGSVRRDRPQLVGLKGIGRKALVVGSRVRLANSHLHTDGWVTSAGQLTSDGSWIALALIRAGRSRLNEIVAVYDRGRKVTCATIVMPPFYDPSGTRLNG